jgi:hypothetical protein
MTDAREDVLLPCPFCGSAAKRAQWLGPLMQWRVRCIHCEGRNDGHKTKAEAIAAWNKCHSAEPKPQEGLGPTGECQAQGDTMFCLKCGGHDCIHRQARMEKKRLVLIEWEDSAQPVSAWQFQDDVKVAAVRIASVGWLLKDGKKVKALAPNVGGLDGKTAPQVSGVISIPTRCVIQITSLVEQGDTQ